MCFNALRVLIWVLMGRFAAHFQCALIKLKLKNTNFLLWNKCIIHIFPFKNKFHYFGSSHIWNVANKWRTKRTSMYKIWGGWMRHTASLLSCSSISSCLRLKSCDTLFVHLHSCFSALASQKVRHERCTTCHVINCAWITMCKSLFFWGSYEHQVNTIGCF